MARRPAAAESACARFAALLIGHLARGTRPATADGEPWTDAGFAAEVPSERSEDGYASPRSVSNWRKGAALPDEIEGIVRALFGPSDRHAEARDALRSAFRAARLEKSEKTLARAKPDPAGARWVLDGDRFAIDRGPRPTDRRAAANPLRQQLQAAISDYAEELARRAKRLANTSTWGKMASDAASLHGFAALGPLEVPAHLGEAYALMLRLGRYLDTDVRLQKDPMRLDEPLDPNIHGALTDLVRTAAPWLRDFPTIAAWDDAAGKALVRADLFQPAREFARIAREKNAISADDAAEVDRLADAADAGDFQGQKAGARTVGSAKNLMVAAARSASGSLVPWKTTAEASPALVRHAMATLAAAGREVEALAATLPDDMRLALRVLIEEGHRGREHPVEDPRRSGPAVPEDVEAQAHDMILAGRAPPAEWRPHIRDLDFGHEALQDLEPLAGLSGLRTLYLNETQVSDVSALSGLSGLQNLDLEGTQVSDVSALSGLSGLRTLYLNETQVSDVSALSGLSGLQNLYLSNTQVSDVSALSGLSGLRTLYLNETQVSDVSALSGLSGLQNLDLEGTQVSDVSALSGLSGLQSLDLRETQVSDVSALSGLSGLQDLDLRGTPVSDVSALSGLSGLQSLYLSNTQVSDVSALSGLSGLQNLYLSNTQVSDVSALSGLSGLRTLYLNETQVSDVSALSGLSGLQNLDLEGTQVSDVSALSGLSGLQSLDLSNTQVSDVSALSGLKNLQIFGVERGKGAQRAGPRPRRKPRGSRKA